MTVLCSDATLESLRTLAGQVPADQVVVEVGSYRGDSAMALASGGPHVYAVDPWDLPGNVGGKHGYTNTENRRVFEEKVRDAGFEDRVTLLQAFSVDAARDWPGYEIGLLFIDGDHDYNAVRADVAAWRPYLAQHAVMAFDDYGTQRNPGVRAAVKELHLPIQVLPDNLAVVHNG